MVEQGRFTDMAMAACYFAVAAVIVAHNRRELSELYHEINGWWKIHHPTGKMFADVREAANRDKGLHESE